LSLGSTPPATLTAGLWLLLIPCFVSKPEVKVLLLLLLFFIIIPGLPVKEEDFLTRRTPPPLLLTAGSTLAASSCATLNLGPGRGARGSPGGRMGR
jgi:hypothetical protein